MTETEHALYSVETNYFLHLQTLYKEFLYKVLICVCTFQKCFHFNVFYN